MLHSILCLHAAYSLSIDKYIATYKIYQAIECYKFSQHNAWVAVGSWVLNKTMRSEELSNNYTAAVYVYCNTGEEIVNVNLNINQAVK